MERGPNVMRLVEWGSKYDIVKTDLAMAEGLTALEAPRKCNNVHWFHVRISSLIGFLFYLIKITILMPKYVVSFI